MIVFVVEIMKPVGETQRVGNTWITTFDWNIDKIFLSRELAFKRCKQLQYATRITELKVEKCL